GRGDAFDLRGLAGTVSAFDGDEESGAEAFGRVSESAGRGLGLRGRPESVNDDDGQTLQFMRVEGEESDDSGDECGDAEDEERDVAGGQNPVGARTDFDRAAEVECVDHQ